MAEFKRSARVSEGVRVELSSILQDGHVRDPDVGYVTVTDVVVSEDLRHARVFVSIYGEQDKQDKSIGALKRAAPFLRRELGSRLRMRFTPELDFVLDTSLERGARIDTLLKRIERGETENLEVTKMPDALPVSTGNENEPLVVPPPPTPRSTRNKSAKKRRNRR
jgi:ribosome-binding factor A